MKSVKAIVVSSFLLLGIACAKANVPIFTDVEKPIVLKTSEAEFIIKMASNPTTGYDWFLLDGVHEQVIIPVSSEYLPPERTSGMVGAGGYRVWHFKLNPSFTLVPYATELKFIYARAWETEGKVKTITIRTLVDQ